MQQDDLLHLRELRDAHTARLRVLEVQSAQLGVNCPAHVKVEIASIKEALYVIEQQVGGNFPFSEAARTNAPNLSQTSTGFHRGYVDWTAGQLTSPFT